MLPFEEFKKLSKAPVEHLFGTHEWCSPEWCFATEIDRAMETYVQKASAAVPSPPPTTAAPCPVSNYRRDCKSHYDALYTLQR